MHRTLRRSWRPRRLAPPPWLWISKTYVTVPWWLWLGIGGALLIFIAARYEKRMRALGTAFTAVTSLR